MTRRRAILAVAAAPIAFPLGADDTGDIWELLTQAAAALSAGNAPDFMQAFDRSMPGYQMLATNISGLTAAYEVQSSIEILTEDRTGSTRTVELDWYLQLIEQQDGTNTIRRRNRVTCRLMKIGKKWKIVALEPMVFFAPPARGG
ncbi:MAG TPA: hypothetical protein VH640_16395 [Bryobacteraceae bacterium]|jgi:hypothetical protein